MTVPILLTWFTLHAVAVVMILRERSERLRRISRE